MEDGCWPSPQRDLRGFIISKNLPKKVGSKFVPFSALIRKKKSMKKCTPDFLAGIVSISSILKEKSYAFWNQEVVVHFRELSSSVKSKIQMLSQTNSSKENTK